ncbi:MAG: hypothetical protein ACREU2_06660 [Steroidobacteraceae bacterium]
MSVIQALQKMKAETEALMPRLRSGSSRLYEISTNGTITERTTQMRSYFRRHPRLLQRLIDRLSKTH